jgi:predicted RNase H-like HicB family nuclease
MSKAVLCVASGRDSQWEAFCLDYDLAVQGQSFEEVRGLLKDAIEMYVDTAVKEPEPNRSRLLARWPRSRFA